MVSKKGSQPDTDTQQPRRKSRAFTPAKGRPTHRRNEHAPERALSSRLQWFLVTVAAIALAIVLYVLMVGDGGPPSNVNGSSVNGSSSPASTPVVATSSWVAQS